MQRGTLKLMELTIGDICSSGKDEYSASSSLLWQLILITCTTLVAKINTTLVEHNHGIENEESS